MRGVYAHLQLTMASADAMRHLFMKVVSKRAGVNTESHLSRCLGYQINNLT